MAPPVRPSCLPVPESSSSAPSHLLPSTAPSAAAGRSRGTVRRAAAGEPGGGAGHAADGPAGSARGAPGEPGGGVVDGGAREAPGGAGAAATGREAHGGHPGLVKHLDFPSPSTSSAPWSMRAVEIDEEVEGQRRKKRKDVENGSENPYLTDKNKKDRLKWCLSMLDPSSVPHDPMFRGLFDYVFIEEKWHYITRKSETDNTVPRVMILTAVARPRFDSLGFCTFDGKIGCFPFVTYGTVKRSSAKRPAGTQSI